MRLLTAFLLMVSGMAMAQSVEQLSGMPRGTSARAIALGNSYVAETYDGMVMYWNPAAIVYLDRTSIVNNASMGSSDRLFRDNLVVPVLAAKDVSVIAGIQGNYFGSQWTSPTAAFHSLDVAVATKVSPTVSLGVLIETRYSTIYGQSLWTASGAVGAFYYPAPGISYGLAFTGLGWGTTFSENNSVPSLDYTKVLPKSLEVGLTMRFPSYYEKPDLVVSAADEKLLGKDESYYKAGIEYRLNKSIVVRGGIIRYASATVLTPGVGLSVGSLELDYSYAQDEFLVYTHFFSVSYVIPASL